MNAIETKSKDVSRNTAAIIAGIGILIMAIIAPIANFSILNGLIEPGNATDTFKNILESEGQFRIGIFINLIVAVLDMVVAWALYIFLKPVNKSLSLLAAWFRIIYAALLMAALFHLVSILQLISGTEYLATVEPAQLESQLMLSLHNFFLGWDLGLTVFGFHLLILGYLILKAGYMKNILGILTILASLGYLIDGFGKILSPDYNIEMALFTFIGELVLIFWLLIKGRKIDESN